MKKKLSMVIVGVAVTLIGCAAFVAPKPMRGSDVTAADTAPELKTFSSKTPGVGEPQLIARTFPGQPPMVPHSIEKYVPLTADENACLDCHISDELRGQKVPKMGKSHFVNATDSPTPTVSMARFQCDSCHVVQADAKPLVENKFISVSK